MHCTQTCLGRLMPVIKCHVSKSLFQLRVFFIFVLFKPVYTDHLSINADLTCLTGLTVFCLFKIDEVYLTFQSMEEGQIYVT